MLINCFSGVMISVLSSSVVECGFEHRSGQTKDYKIGMCCFSAKHVTIKGKSKVRIMCVSGATYLSFSIGVSE
jgi:hypothetical protein